MKLTRIDAIKIIDRATDKDDPFWEHVVEDWYDEKNDDIPSIYDVLVALGITESEYRQASGADGQISWPKP
jgi:general stress protein 26